MINTTAVIFEQPEKLALRQLELSPPGDEDLVVDIHWTGISTGTEKLLWLGNMPTFPGMGYPLVPGYESVGRVLEAGRNSGGRIGEMVFVPGAKCFGEVRGLFGGAAKRLVVPGARTARVPEHLNEQAVLLALAATGYHAIAKSGLRHPQLIVGHGVLGRLIARIVIATGGSPPTVWENNPQRASGEQDYMVVGALQDPRKDYRLIVDVSGDASMLDALIARLAPGGEVVLAGFYSQPLAFAFAPAFMREASISIAAQWAPTDLAAVIALIESGRLSLDGLITHRHRASDADAAYRIAFGDPACLKMILDWRLDS